MIANNNKIKNKNFFIYGLGKTGESALKFLKKENVKNLISWDDFKKIEKKIDVKSELDNSDFIVLSPGINLRKTKFSHFLIKNKKKIITDLDLFYLKNSESKTIVVTGTNGKSTTCKLIEHVLKTNGYKTNLGGNIGKPILSLNNSKKNIIIIEASSFQLEYSKFVKPNLALFLNFAKDHLDWHGSVKKYFFAKLKIFKNQNQSDIAFVSEKRIIKGFKKLKFRSSLRLIKPLKERFLNKIKNNYLKMEVNISNISFVYILAKKFKIKDNLIIRSLNSFKGLDHRHEVFINKNKTLFINDSKATTFQSTKFALNHNKNIYWIVGGLPKKKDNINISNFKNNIVKAYIIGKNFLFFKKKLHKHVDYKISGTLERAIQDIIKDFKKNLSHKTVLLSPASASYDQFLNFEHRGNKFKSLVKKNEKLFFKK